MPAPCPPASPGWVQIPLWGTSQPWGAGQAGQQGWPPTPWAAGARPSATGRRPEAEAAPGAGWVWLANTHWDTGSRLRVRGARLPGPPAVTEILQVLGALGCNSAVFAQSLMAQTSGVKCPSSRAGAVWGVRLRGAASQGAGWSRAGHPLSRWIFERVPGLSDWGKLGWAV